MSEGTDIIYRTVKSAPLTHSEQDDNFRAVLEYRGAHVVGDVYTKNQVVVAGTLVAIALRTTTETPSVTPTDWDVIQISAFFAGT